jgi:hypothetical protein
VDTQIRLSDAEAGALTELLEWYADGGVRPPYSVVAEHALYSVLQQMRESRVRGIWCHTCGVWHSVGCMVNSWLVPDAEVL